MKENKPITASEIKKRLEQWRKASAKESRKKYEKFAKNALGPALKKHGYKANKKPRTEPGR